MAYFVHQYATLISSMRSLGYDLLPLDSLFRGLPEKPTVYLRHDVDRLSFRCLALARLEREVGASATYYFRSSRDGRFPASAIRNIAANGHVIGYHYECMARAKGNVALASQLFARDLRALRKLAPVASAAMHGSPLSRYDNRELWNHSPLSIFNLVGEAYLSLQGMDIHYLTDTGGRFGSAHNRRDQLGRDVHTGRGSTHEVIQALSPNRHPLVVLSTHPERWASSWPGYVQAALCDVGANLLKRAVYGLRRQSNVGRG